MIPVEDSMDQATSSQTPAELAEAMNANAILVSIELHKLGLRRKVRATRATIDDTTVGDADGQIQTKRVGVSKKILDIPEAEAIRKLDAALYQDIVARALPANYRRGVYLWPVALVEWLEERWARYLSERQEMIDAFVAAYRDGIEASRVALGPIFDPSDYPDEDEVRESYWAERTYQQVSAPEVLSRFSPSLYREAETQLREQMESLAAEARVEMRVGLLELTKHLRDALTPGEDGKSKKLFQSTVDKFNLWLQLFDSRNITGDEQLAGVVSQLRAVMGEDVDRKTLRKDETIRDRVLETMGQAVTDLDQLVEDKPAGLVGGALNFDD